MPPLMESVPPVRDEPVSLTSGGLSSMNSGMEQSPLAEQDLRFRGYGDFRNFYEKKQAERDAAQTDYIMATALEDNEAEIAKSEAAFREKEAEIAYLDYPDGEYRKRAKKQGMSIEGEFNPALLAGGAINKGLNRAGHAVSQIPA